MRRAGQFFFALSFSSLTRRIVLLNVAGLLALTGQGSADVVRVPDPTPAQVQEQAAQQTQSRREGMRGREREGGR